MPYPTVSKAEARSYLHSKAEETDFPTPPTRTSDYGPDLDWEALGSEVAAKILLLLDQNSPDGKIDGSAFEAAAAPEIHKLLPAHPALADSEFWIWLAVAHCEEIVDRRYTGKPNPQNFGVGGAGENLLYRLWLRAEIAYDPSMDDQYTLARFGDIDFWRSHVFRQGYGDVRSFARALLEFQFPVTAKRKPRLKISQIRALAKRLKRARSNLMFEVMSEARAAEFIESEWSRLAEKTL